MKTQKHSLMKGPPLNPSHSSSPLSLTPMCGQSCHINSKGKVHSAIGPMVKHKENLMALFNEGKIIHALQKMGDFSVLIKLTLKTT